MKTRLWIVLLIVVAWTSFLIGYSVSALTGVKPPAAEVKGAGGHARAAGETEARAGGGRGGTSEGWGRRLRRGRGKVQGWGRRLQRRRRTPEDRRCASEGRGGRLRQQGLVPCQLTSPYGVLGRRRSSTYNRVRLRPAPPSG